MSNQQIHKRLSDEQIAFILAKYASKEISLSYALEHLQLKRAGFFKLLANYRNNPDGFTAATLRNQSDKRKISSVAEQAITAELMKEKQLIENKNMPIKFYNYSAVRDDILAKHAIEISVPTIISRAKQNDFYIARPEKKVHDREVITNFFAELFEHEFSWNHILAIESVVLTHGCPLKYYPDQHAIFRFVKDRDKFTPWQTHTKFTDDVTPQWKQVLQDCDVGVTYALSPQAKGKVERPYQWLQDRIVRTCAKEKVTDIAEVRKVLKELVHAYNYRWVHSTTKEIPAQRLERAKQESKTMFREFKVKEPFESSKDIFCLRDRRVVDCYHKISINNCELKVPLVPQKNTVELRIVPDYDSLVAEVRMWFKNRLVSVQKVAHEDLSI